MKNFRTLDLALDFCKLTKSLKVSGPLRNQLERASCSIALNLAEARGRHTTKDQLKFFYIALGSIRECETILKLLEINNKIILDKLDHLGASTYLLIKHAL